MTRPRFGDSAPFGRRLGAVLTGASLVVALQFAAAPTAGAKPGLTTGLADNYATKSIQGELFELTARARAEMVRIPVSWRASAPTRPSNPRDPADPGYDFSGIDSAVRAAQARGFGVLFTVFSAPDWAEGPNRPPDVRPGTWNPNPNAFGDFGHALARRYSGTFTDSDAAPIPRVRNFEVWNEANLKGFLGPQWNGTKPRSPRIYRSLLNAFYGQVHAAGKGNVVIGGGLAPYGDPPGRTRMRPLFFLRQLFCLKGRRKLKPKRCPAVKMDAFSHHPISVGSPRSKPLHPDDGPTGQISRLKRTLRAAEKGGTVKPRGRRPLWVTEFWWPSAPPASPDLPLPHGGVPLDKHARWIQEALYLFWSKGFRTAIYFDVRDSAGLFPSGLFFADNAPKPALQAFRFPFVTERKRGKRVRAWGKSPQAGRLVIERQRGSGWRTLKRLKVGAGKVFTAKLRLRGAAVLRARVGEEQSRHWRQRG